MTRLESIKNILLYKRIIVPLSAICLFVFLYRNLRIGKMWSFSDLLPFNTERNIDLFLGTWDSNFLGYPYIMSSLNIGNVFLSSLINNDILAQNIYYLSILPMSFLTMYFLSKKFIVSDSGRYFASFLYALNPITIGEFYNGSTWMNVYALSPLIILFVIKFLDTGDLFYGLIISILFGFAGSNLWIDFWTLIFPIILIIIAESATKLRKKDYSFVKGISLLFIFIFIGLLLLLPSINFIFSIKNTAYNSNSVQSYILDIKYDYKEGTPFNLFRMAGNAGSPMDKLGYDDISIWTLFGFIIPIIVSFEMLKNKKMLDNIYIITFLFIIFIVITFMYLTKLGLTYSLFEKVPILFSLRNPKYLMYSFSLAISIFFGMGISRITNKYKNKRRYAILGIIFLFMFVYLYPIWNGNMGLERRGEYTVPESYYTTFKYLKNDDGNYRVLWLPYTYNTQTRLVNNINHIGVKLGQHISTSPSLKNIENLFLSITYNRTENISQNLGMYNVKYIVIEKNSGVEYKEIKLYYEYMTPFIRGPGKKFVEFFDSTKGINKKYEDDKIMIYENAYFRPYIYLYNISNVDEKVENNLIKNGDFSDSMNYWRVWNREFGSNVSIIGNNLNIDNPSEKHNIPITQKFSAIPGNTYNISVFMNTDANGSHAKIAWFLYGENFSENSAIRHDVIRKFLTIEGRKLFREEFIAPKGVGYGILYLVGGKSGNTSFSEIKITEENIDALIPTNSNVSNIISLKKEAVNDELTINVKTEVPSVLVISESYDSDWNAYIGDTPLTHIKVLNWANGFIIPKNINNTIKVEYEPQKDRDVMLIIWIIVWIFVIVTFILLINQRSKKQ